jgi:hypothetical protein
LPCVELDLRKSKDKNHELNEGVGVEIIKNRNSLPYKKIKG